MFESVLVANRGEIAVRIMRTCREMGIRTVAVYSDADRDALHVRAADQAIPIGPAPALQSYLNVPELVRVARESGAEAVHPGYGFLAENGPAARAVVDAGLVWVGPSGDVIEALGDKVAAKGLARTAGVPVIPGYSDDDQSESRLLHEADRIGYPLMLKAAAGGGGKGMRAVYRAEELPGALEGARREARSAFGDDRVFLEKLLLNPRHIEMQFIADTRGDALYLGERDCSIQRRHQKVVEEAPSPVMTAQGRIAMGEAALRLVRAAGYTNAGTVEFLYSGGDFYFLEVNARIQVEHPVTELVTGLDLIRLQLEVAAGLSLPVRQGDLEVHGHAIEVRLYAEDAAHGFLPATGAIEVHLPPIGPGVRVDAGVAAGSVVSQYYDPLLAKLVVHAPDRAQAVHRLRDALARYAVLGPITNLNFLSWIAAHQDFGQARVDTGWLDRTWAADQEPDHSAPDDVLVASALVEMSSRPAEPAVPAGDRFSPWRAGTAWRGGGAASTFRYEVGGEPVEVRVTTMPEGYTATVGGARFEAGIRQLAAGQYSFRLNGAIRSLEAVSTEAGVLVHLDGLVHDVRRARRSGGGVGDPSGPGVGGSLSAPMPGTVVKVSIAAGDHVSAHDALVVLEAMKMEHVIVAPYDGVVEAVLVAEGDLVPAGSPVARLAPE